MTRSRGVVDLDLASAASAIAGTARASCEDDERASDELTPPEVVGGENPDEAAMIATDDLCLTPLFQEEDIQQSCSDFTKPLNSKMRVCASEPRGLLQLLLQEYPLQG